MTRKWQPAQDKYDAYSNELFGLRESCRHFKHWLTSGYKIEAYVDNKSLANALQQKDDHPNPRISRHVSETRTFIEKIYWHFRNTPMAKQVDALARYYSGVEDLDELDPVGIPPRGGSKGITSPSS